MEFVFSSLSLILGDSEKYSIVCLEHAPKHLLVFLVSLDCTVAEFLATEKGGEVHRPPHSYQHYHASRWEEDSWERRISGIWRYAFVGKTFKPQSVPVGVNGALIQKQVLIKKTYELAFSDILENSSTY